MRRTHCVLLGDLPDCDASTIARVVAAYDDDVDVVIPQAGERFGHPWSLDPSHGADCGLGDGDGLNGCVMQRIAAADRGGR